MVKRLLDKVIVITGGTSGIGLEIARHSISQGAYVVISGRRENEGKRIVTQLGEKCQFMECDVLYEDQICKLVEETFSQHGRIDVMFNNAGAPDFIRNIEDISYDKIRHSLDLLLTSVIIGTREVTKIMSKQDVLSFMQTYQRVTQNMFRYMPKYASIIINLNSNHQIKSAVYKYK